MNLQFLSSEEYSEKLIKIAKNTSLFVVVVIVVMLFVISSIRIIPTSHIGIRKTFSVIHDKQLKEGLHIKIPFIQSIDIFSIKTIQEEHILSNIQAKDMQEITVSYKVAYRIPSDKVIYNAKTLQGDVYNVIIEPRIKETMADVIVQYTAEEVISKREEISKIVRGQIMKNKEIVDRCIIEEVVLMKFDFSDSLFKEAINKKKRAIQYAEQAEIEKKTAKAKAEQMIFSAEGKAKAIKLEAQAMKENQKIVEIKAIERWDGTLPKVLITNGKNTPSIINIPSNILENTKND